MEHDSEDDSSLKSSHKMTKRIRASESPDEKYIHGQSPNSSFEVSLLFKY